MPMNPYRNSIPKKRVLSDVLKQLVLDARTKVQVFTYYLLLLKGGDPAARSRTATLLRLHPSHYPHRGRRPPEG